MNELSFQSSLFGDESLQIAEPLGLAYQEEFLSATEERELKEIISTLPLDFAPYKEYTARRRVLSFGHSFDYDTNTLRHAPGIPAEFEPLRKRAADWVSVEATAFVQLLVAEYAPGTPLGWHRDVPAYGIIVGISLGTAAKLRFRPYPHTSGLKTDVRELEVAPRSVYSMRGSARWEWQHSVPPTPGVRWSLTFRTRR